MAPMLQDTIRLGEAVAKRAFVNIFLGLFIIVGPALQASADCRETLQSKSPQSIIEYWPEFLGFIRQQSQRNIDGEVRVEWGQSPGDQSNRTKIRDTLSHRFVFSNDIFDLSEPPLMLMGSVSITHTFGMGGYIHSPSDRVGFDVEQAKRPDNLKPEIFSRILTANEVSTLEQQPKSIIWAIKEAAFKALSNPNLTLLSEIEITDINVIEQNYFYLSGRSLKGPASRFEGWAKVIGPYVVAVAFRNSIFSSAP